MPSLSRHEKVTRFMEFSANGKKTIEKIFSHKLFVIVWIALLRSIYFNFLHSFQIILFLTILTQMPSLNWYQKVTIFMELSVNGKKQLKKTFLTSFSSLFQLHCYSQVTSILHSFQIILFLTILTQLPALNWYQKVTLFMELSADGKKQLKKNILQVFRHYFNCKAAVKLIQFLTFISDHSVFNNICSNAFFKSTRE